MPSEHEIFECFGILILFFFLGSDADLHSSGAGTKPSPKVPIAIHERK